MFRIAERAGIPAEVWHLKTAYKANWGKMPEVLKRFEAARARGPRRDRQQVSRTTAPSNGLDACLPLWVREGGTDAMLKRLPDPALRERIKREMDDPNAKGWENQWYGSGGGDGVMLSSVLNPELQKYEGMTLTEIGKAMGKDPRDAVMDLVVADRGESYVIISIMEEADVRTALAHPLVVHRHRLGRARRGRPAVGIEVAPARLGHVRAHPRQVRARREAADARGGHPQDDVAAGRARRPERPRHPAPGLLADITVFDPATIRDVATFEDPNHYSVGVKHVFVNGEAVVATGRSRRERPGQPVRGPGFTAIHADDSMTAA